ncbi:unnamed protein product [Chrysoparadoxa australica]
MFGAPKPCLRRECTFTAENQPELRDEEEILETFEDIALSFTNDSQSTEGQGGLTVTSNRVIWKEKGDGKVFDFDVPYISLHAVSRDATTYPEPCIYCQLDEDEEVLSEAFFSLARDGSDSDGEVAAERKIETLQRIFAALSKAAELCPFEDDAGLGK